MATYHKCDHCGRIVPAAHNGYQLCYLTLKYANGDTPLSQELCIECAHNLYDITRLNCSLDDLLELARKQDDETPCHESAE